MANEDWGGGGGGGEFPSKRSVTQIACDRSKKSRRLDVIGDEAHSATWSLGQCPGDDDGRMQCQSWQRKKVD